MIPGPRPAKGHDRLSAGRDRGLEVVRALRPGRVVEVDDVSASDERRSGGRLPAVTVTRTTRGWSVLSPAGAAHAGDLVEGLTLADLVAEELGRTRRAGPQRPPVRPRSRPGRAAGRGCSPTPGWQPWSAPSPSWSTRWRPGSRRSARSVCSPSGTGPAPAPRSSRCAARPAPRGGPWPSWPGRSSRPSRRPRTVAVADRSSPAPHVLAAAAAPPAPRARPSSPAVAAADGRS